MFTEAFADIDALVCYAMKANSNQAVLRTLARLGAGADVVSGGELAPRAGRRHPASQDRVLRRRQDACDELRAALDHDILCFNVESEPELRGAVGAGRVDGQDRAHLDPRQSGRRRQDPRQDLHRQVGEQVRHSAASKRPRGLCARRQAAGHRASPASTCISAARSPISARSTTRSRCWRDFVTVLRGDGHTISHVDLGGGLGIPYREDNDPPPRAAGLCRDRASASRAISAAGSCSSPAA